MQATRKCIASADCAPFGDGIGSGVVALLLCPASQHTFDFGRHHVAGHGRHPTHVVAEAEFVEELEELEESIVQVLHSSIFGRASFQHP
jgi:hypothetical protein